ncbi:MAG: hypothetical protein AAF089_02070 [Bacteroidota bacterium]
MLKDSFHIRNAHCIALLVFAAVSFVGCGPKVFEDADALYAYVYSDKYPSKDVVNREGVTVVARYLPTNAVMVNDYRAAERQAVEIRSDASLTESERTQRIEALERSLRTTAAAFDQSVYFNVTLGFDSGEDIVYSKLQRRGYGSYSAWLETLLFGIEEQLSLRNGPLELEPTGYLLDRMYGMTPTRSFLVSFPKAGLDQSTVQLCLGEIGLGTGTLTFDFDIATQPVQYRLPS